MIVVQDLRPGVVFKMDGQPYVVLKYEHIKMGRGSATIKVKIKGILNGSVIEKSFANTARVEEAEVSKRQLQYLYSDGNSYSFMDPISFEQVEVEADALADQAVYLTEGGSVIVQFYEGRAIGIDLPLKMSFEVVECDPGVKGNSATNLYKGAKLSNGLDVKVPLFIEQGEFVVVDTRSGEYVERAK